MAVKLNEDTEVRLSLKTIGTIVFAAVALTSIVVRYETKIEDLVDEIDKLKQHVRTNSESVEENTDKILNQQIDLIKLQKDVEYITVTGDTNERRRQERPGRR